MAKQLTLLPEPKIEQIVLDEENLWRLTEIAYRAANQELLCGEPRSHQLVDRLMEIEKYFSEANKRDYSIRFENQIIGYAKIDDGWNYWENRYHDPEVKLAFIDPAFGQYGSGLKTNIEEILKIIKENQYE